MKAGIRAILRADYARGNRSLQAERAAECQHPIAHLHAIRIPEPRDWQGAIWLDLDDREIGQLIRADHFRGVVPRVLIQRNFDLRGLIDDVVVRHDVALSINDHARTQATFRAISLIRSIKKVIEEILQVIAIPARAFLGSSEHLRC